MPKSKQKPPTWPSDDQVRAHEGDEQFADDGRKLQDSERVGGISPDADPDRSRTAKPAKPTPR